MNLNFAASGRCNSLYGPGLWVPSLVCLILNAFVLCCSNSKLNRNDSCPSSPPLPADAMYSGVVAFIVIFRTNLSYAVGCANRVMGSAAAALSADGGILLVAPRSCSRSYAEVTGSPRHVLGVTADLPVLHIDLGFSVDYCSIRPCSDSRRLPSLPE